MLVTVNNPIAVGPTNDFGEIFTVVDDDADAAKASTRTGLSARGNVLHRRRAAPRVRRHRTAGGDFNPERIQIDDDIGVLAGFVSPAAQSRRAARRRDRRRAATTSAITR